MKKLLLATGAALGLSAVAGQAVAFELAVASGTPAATTNVYAAEIRLPLAAGTGLTIMDDATSVLGFGVATGQRRFLRFNLSGGATFNTLAPALSIAGGTVTNGVVVAGGLGQSFITYEITAAVDLGPDAIVTLDFPATGAIRVASQDTVTMNYRLYETASDAVGQTGPLFNATADAVRFARAVVVNPQDIGSYTANVGAANGVFTQFLVPAGGFVPPQQGALNGPVALLGVNLQLPAAPAATPLLQNGANGALTDFVNAAAVNSVTVEGDFSARAPGGVFFAVGGTCAMPGTPVAATVAMDSLSATANFTLAQLQGMAGRVTLCYAVTGTTAIPAANYSGTVSLVSADPVVYTVIGGRTGAGRIVRNGTVLRAPFLQGGGAYRTSVILTNTSALLPAPFTTACYNTQGVAVAGATGTVPANRSLERTAGSFCSGVSGLSAAEFTFAIPEGNVIGTVKRINSTTGDGAVDALLGNYFPGL